jgi:hypothetical protein
MLLLLFLVWAGSTYAQTNEGDITVQAEGVGISKNDALLKAKRDAVEKGIGTFLISQTEIKNFELQKDVILTKTVGAVKHYDILEEKQQGPKDFFVRIQAVVALADIKADLAALKILLESMDKPRMMVVIQEQGGKIAENAIIDYLRQKGFDLVDAAAVAALMQKGDQFVRRAVTGDPAAAAQLGASNGAEYVIVGTVTKSLKESAFLKESGMVSGQASISAKVVNCSTAKVISANSTSSAAVHVSADTAQAQATAKAAAKLMDRSLFEAIVASFQDMVNNGLPLDVVVKTVPDFKTQKAVQQLLAGLDGVVSASKKAFSSGQLSLAVVYKGNADAFSEAVDGRHVLEKRLSVTDIVGSRVTIQLE